MRPAFVKCLLELAERDSRVVVIAGDVGSWLWDDFCKRWPHRFLNPGTCEQAMIGMAAGLALSGLRPICYAITPHLIERPFEFIKLDIAAQNAPVGLVGYADYPYYGITHAELDGPKLMSMLPAIQSCFPKSSAEVERFFATVDMDRPFFLSLKSEPK